MRPCTSAPNRPWTRLPASPRLLPAALLLALVAGCSTGSRAPAPVEERAMSGQARRAPAASADARTMPGAENVGKPGYYSVKPGDTLVRIALDNGQNWRDLARWNRMDNPNVIEIGQVLRVSPPPGEVVTARAAQAGTPPATAQANPSSTATTAPVQSSAVQPQAMAPAAAGSAPQSAPAARAPEPSGVPPEDEIAWAWPTPAGTALLAGFDEARNKGLDIGGKAGDPVLAAADGRVVYAGAGLRGYGNLIILKHNNSYLTAYAHNQSLLVKEEQTVRKGQRIAEMGSTDADRVKLHFEIRRLGKPVDPAKLLPAR